MSGLHLPVRLFLAVAALELCTGACPAAGPAWWTDRGIITPSLPSDDFAYVNQGQYKNIAYGAYLELRQAAPWHASDALDATIASWLNSPSGADAYLTLTQGQAKNVAKLFYDRLAELGFKSAPLATGQTYPWTVATTDDDSYAYTNIGQAKNIFSFDLFKDSDGDGMPDWWESAHSLNPASATDAFLDGDNDGFSNLEEYQQFLDPAVAESPQAAFKNTDRDGDGLTDQQEAIAGSNPLLPDTDGDGYWDGADYAPTNPAVRLPPSNPADVTPPTLTLVRP